MVMMASDDFIMEKHVAASIVLNDAVADIVVVRDQPGIQPM